MFSVFSSPSEITKHERDTDIKPIQIHGKPFHIGESATICTEDTSVRTVRFRIEDRTQDTLRRLMMKTPNMKTKTTTRSCDLSCARSWYLFVCLLCSKVLTFENIRERYKKQYTYKSCIMYKRHVLSKRFCKNEHTG